MNSGKKELYAHQEQLLHVKGAVGCLHVMMCVLGLINGTLNLFGGLRTND